VRRLPAPPRVPTLLGLAAFLTVVSAGSAVVPPGAVPGRVPGTRSTSGAESAVLAYLSGPARGRTVSGQHNREPLDDPTKWTEKVHDITGKYPGLWGGDLSFHSLADRRAVVAEAQRQWSAGSLVTLTWHMCPPTAPEPCGWDSQDGVWARLSDAQWQELITEGTPLNRAWRAQLDAVVPLLRQLRDAGVEVLWRPLHEMNDSWPWWGGRPGPDGSRRLYQLMHDYFVGTQDLTNLVWVWDVSDRQLDDAGDFFPGDDYVDVAAVDIWQKDYPTLGDYLAMRRLAHGRPIALGEVNTVPSPEVLAQQPGWAWFMTWAEKLVDSNSEDAVKACYYDPHVLNRDDVRRDRRPPGST
jgi:mannan endo-1,4-beta-mannosidase